jgi:UDP-3-O-[3-hydroxymyristoyl] glucosamine N-acyltransferase
VIEAPMGDARFFSHSSPHGLAAVVAAAGGQAPESARMFSGVAPLRSAGPNDVSFLDNRRYVAALDETAAGAVIVTADLRDRVPAGTVAIVTATVSEGWARVAELFHPRPPVRPGIHRTATIEDGATVDPSAEIGAYTLIEAGAEIGANCRIGPHASIGAGVTIGRDARVGAHVSISHAHLGCRVTLFPGVRIGQEGFGFAATKTGFLTIPQLGRVIVGDDVEIGANSTVDRGSTGDTIIGAGTRLDNLVQIGHNVRLGRCCVIVAQAGIAGSTVVEDFVQIGGQAAITGHLRIGAGSKIAGQSGVIGDVAPGAILMGTPAQPRKAFYRQLVTLKRLTRDPG